MRIGIDFDNTIAGYDALFNRLVRDHGWLADGAGPLDKPRLRAAIRALDAGEAKWRRLQAEAYGPRMGEATLMAGVDDFIRACAERFIPVFIVSHKTRFAAAAPDGADLRQAALSWMTAHGFFSADGLGLPREAVFFESTRAEKLGRIRSLGCTHFIDDLEEVLGDPAFPDGVERFLYRPDAMEMAPSDLWTRARSWAEIEEALLG